MAENILITGGAGYVGSVLVPMLLQAGYSVSVLDSFLFHQPTLIDSCIHSNFSIERGDCRDRSLMTRLVKDADYIIPLAAIVGRPPAIWTPPPLLAQTSMPSSSFCL